MAAAITAAGTLGATVRYVAADGTGDGSSWANAMSDLQAAIDASSSGDEIWVKQGTYKPTSLIKSNKPTSKAFILKEGVSLYGGFAGTETSTSDRVRNGDNGFNLANVTELNADDDVPDVWTRTLDGTSYRWTWETENDQVTGTSGNSSHVLYCSSSFTEQTVIDGFTLRGANANVYQATASGGAVYALGNVTLRNCTMYENSAYFKVEADSSNALGGAVYLNGGTMEQCLVSRAFCHSSYGSGVGGAVYAKDAQITGCMFVDCVGLDGGGAVYMIRGSLSDCRFSNCYGSSGGAIYNNGGTIENITIEGCRAINGGGLYNAYGTVRNAIIYNCYADVTEYSSGEMGGGALCMNGGNASGIVAYNNTAFAGGGVYMKAETARLVNSTVLNNAVREGSTEPANIHISNADNVLNTIWDSSVNLAGNFVNPTSFAGYTTDWDLTNSLVNANWQLIEGSQFIDTGTPVEGFTEGTDVAGNPRVTGSSIDCGAYEYTDGTPVANATLLFGGEFSTIYLSIGTVGDTPYQVDWGDGNLVTYTEAYTPESDMFNQRELKGNYVRIYGDVRLLKLMGGNNCTGFSATGSPNLEILALPYNYMGNVDVAYLTKLQELDLSDNDLTSLTLPATNTLVKLDIDGNKLTELDFSGVPNLQELDAGDNGLTSFDLTGLSNLTSLSLDQNNLTSIDLSPCPLLTELSMEENALTSIDLSSLPQLSNLELRSNKLTEIDLSGNPQLAYLDVSENKLTELDLSHTPMLETVAANLNELPSIDLTPCASTLQNLSLSGNKLSSINLEGLPELIYLALDFNAFTSIDLSAVPQLEYIGLDNNMLTSVDLSVNTQLSTVYLTGNQLTSLDLSNHSLLNEVYIDYNLMEADAIRSVISQLPETEDYAVLDISYMPGTSGVDITPAEEKGWDVTADYDEETEDTLASLNLQMRTIGTATEYCECVITFTDEAQTQFSISNFQGSSTSLKGTIDADNNVKIYPQVFYVGSDMCLMVNGDNTTANPMEAQSTYVSGHYDGEKLTLQPWNFIKVSYDFQENLGTYYDVNPVSTFVKTNAEMSYKTGGQRMTNSLYATVDGNTVTLYNWAGLGTVQMKRDNLKWYIDDTTPLLTEDDNVYYVQSPASGPVYMEYMFNPRHISFGEWYVVTGGELVIGFDYTDLLFHFDLPVNTEVEEVTVAESPVISTVYYNAAGMSSARPFNGFNIVVTTHADGSQRAKRVMIRN